MRVMTITLMTRYLLLSLHPEVGSSSEMLILLDLHRMFSELADSIGWKLLEFRTIRFHL